MTKHKFYESIDFLVLYLWSSTSCRNTGDFLRADCTRKMFVEASDDLCD